MGELKMAVPLADRSEVLVAVDHRDVPEDLVLTGADPQRGAARAAETLEQPPDCSPGGLRNCATC